MVPMRKHSKFGLYTVALATLLMLAPPAMATLAGSQDSAMRLAQFQALDGGASSTPAPDERGKTVQSEPDAQQQAFTWRALKTGQTLVFEGFVPSAAFQSFIAVRAGGAAKDDTTVRDDAPDGFVRDALAGVSALAALEGGTLSYDGAAWALTGTLASARNRDEIDTALAGAETPLQSWTLKIDTRETEPVADSQDTDHPSQAVPETDQPASDGVSNAAAIDPPNPEPEPAPTPERAVPDPQYRFSALKGADGTLSVQGAVPDPATQALVRALADGAEPDALNVDAAAPRDFVSALYAGLAALDRLDQGQLAYANGTWLLTGYASIDTQKAQALDVLAQLGDPDRFRTMITAPPAAAVCKSELEAFMDGKAILFASGSANLTPQSQALLPDIAQILDQCPRTAVYVEGHTDSDGGAALNLPLSVARAEAVVDELVALGVSVERLYAVGYGSSLPIASNATTDGKRRNRRIVFTFEDIAQ